MILATGAHVAIQAMLNATKAMGPFVEIESNDFLEIVNRQKEPLVVHASKGMFSKKQQYLSPFRGIYLYCESTTPLEITSGASIISAKKLWIPQA